MASFSFGSGPIPTTDEKDVRLSKEERNFLDFLLYQYGDDEWLYNGATDDATAQQRSDWHDSLSTKLDQ